MCTFTLAVSVVTLVSKNGDYVMGKFKLDGLYSFKVIYISLVFSSPIILFSNIGVKQCIKLTLHTLSNDSL